MKKIFRIKDLDCAHCAQKIEDGIRKIDGVESVSLNFMTLRLTIEADEEKFGDVLNKTKKIMHRVEPACSINER